MKFTRQPIYFIPESVVEHCVEVATKIEPELVKNIEDYTKIKFDWLDGINSKDLKSWLGVGLDTEREKRVQELKDRHLRESFRLINWMILIRWYRDRWPFHGFIDPKTWERT